jgi:putative ABC transport system permease protein
MFCAEAAFDVFYEGRKIVLRGNYTDAEYWEIFDFEFLEGKSYTQTQVDNQEQVVVISEQTRDEYFGKGQPAVGLEMVVESRHYKVVGVVKGVARFKYFVAADIYIPYTLFKASVFNNQEILGPFKMVFLSENPHQRAEISAEIKSLENKIVLSNSDYNIIRLDPMTYLEHASRLIFWRENQSEGLRIIILFISGVILLFILVPTLNLINLNISRIMERSSEIGVRKAFGATRYHLMYQFIFENILLTLLGGALGLIMAIIMIKVLNDSKIIPQAELTFNIRVFMYALMVSLTFGIISGFLPAFKMSKMKIVDAIKNIKI